MIEDPSGITAAVLPVGGWADPYRSAVFRLLDELTPLDTPVKGLIGPWAHTYPHQATPGPAMDFIGERLKWFDRFLRENADQDEELPALRAWMPDPVPFGSDPDERPGRWVVEPTWPPENAQEADLHMSQCRLIGRHLHTHEPTTGSLTARGDAAVVRSSLAIGAAAGNVLQFGDLAGRPGDQGADDGRSHTFPSSPLPDRLEILGPSKAELLVSADEPAAQLALRLCEVAPDGTSCSPPVTPSARATGSG